MRTTGTLFGRAEELSTLHGLVADARAGRGNALVLKGEAGIGKTTLLDDAATTATATGLTVLRGTGLEPESELPFAGLHLLLRSVLDAVGDLDPDDARVLRRALGTDSGRTPRTDGDVPVGQALLTLFDTLALRAPVLVVVDDAHWLDTPSAEALLFAARRADAHPVAVLLAARDTHAPAFPTPGVPDLPLARLDDTAVAALLDAHTPDLDRHLRDETVGEAAGNPLAALTLAADRRAG
ncbi:AAA family ATPase, partial [Saccharomonospora halophila]|uniref:AAA family ATPase n=1 Tax=Saccharomonospora halophila TaxID=129922 RepID=UPI000584B59C